MFKCFTGVVTPPCSGCPAPGVPEGGIYERSTRGSARQILLLFPSIPREIAGPGTAQNVCPFRYDRGDGGLGLETTEII